jgi:hypothetical protein
MAVALKRTAIAISTVACVALLSFSWSEQRGVSLGIGSAQAADQSRQYPRAVHGRGLFAEAVAATTSWWNYDDYVCYGVPYAGRGHPPYYSSYPGGYCVRRGNITGLYTRPTLFPRYYVDWGR